MGIRDRNFTLVGSGQKGSVGGRGTHWVSKGVGKVGVFSEGAHLTMQEVGIQFLPNL